MKGFLARTAISAAGLAVAAHLLDGVRIDGLWALAISAILLGLVNGFVRPVAVFLTFPITLVTFGLFLLVVNAAMLGLVALLVAGFQLDGLFAAACTWLIVSVVAWAADRLFEGDDD